MKSLFHGFRSRSSTSVATMDPQPMPQRDPRRAEACQRDAPGETPQYNTGGPLTVVEFFQSQGCNSCPPTNANLLRATSSSAATIPDAIFLTYHVTYWDYLGWKDTFGNNAFDRRQSDYVRGLGLLNAFTPQVIVNGRASGVGNTKAGLAQVLKEGGAGQISPAVEIVVVRDGGSSHGEDLVVQVSPRRRDVVSGHDLDVWLVRYDPSEVNVAIECGENRNEVLPHKNVVRSVKKVGVVRGDTNDVGTVPIAQINDGLEGVILVQDGVGGPIVAAARI